MERIIRERLFVELKNSKKPLTRIVLYKEKAHSATVVLRTLYSKREWFFAIIQLHR